MPPAPPPAFYRITGLVVDDSGNALPGVLISATQSPQDTAISDADGRYELMTMRRAASFVSVKAVKDGYEANYQGLSSSAADVTFNLVMRPIVRIQPGDAYKVTVGPSDTLEGFDWEFRSRRIRVVGNTEEEVQVDLEVTADDGRPAVGLGYGDFLRYPCCTPKLRISLRPGTEAIVHVLIGWNDPAPRTFTLTATQVVR